MRWYGTVIALTVTTLVVATISAERSPRRRCAGRLARERLKAAEKVRDKRYYLMCCAPLCSTPPRRPRPPMTTRRYQPYHKTWWGLKYGCNCSSLGAEGNACDIRTGQCRCKAHVTGRACDVCEEGYWGLELGGCRRCECGAGAAACDPRTGACACAPGVGGTHCDVCLPGYYGFGVAGCLPCPECTDGKVCSPESGRCVCPARSRGPGCKLCAPGFWSRANGCRPCNCGSGAIGDTCDPHTGQCTCKPGWSGLSCDACAVGHFGPRCRPCDCAVAGTSGCVNGTCACDDRGRCPCKENLVGDKCDSCLPGTFGLSVDNPAGCTACFCFGRSAQCAQAQLARAAIHAGTPTHLTLVMSETVTSMDQNSLLSIHTHSRDVTISLPWPPVPVYMELDKRFTGDRVTSYGGALRFRVEEEGGQELPAETKARFPLVRLYAGDIVLDYHERVPAINGTHVVRLHESLWRVRTRSPVGVRASRAALMVALQQLDRILLRATTRAPSAEEHVHALLLNVSLDTAIPGLSRSEPALGVELCDCPRGYSSPSCQEPAIGFWMPRPKVHFTNVAGTIVISLEGESQPCKCNGRATACDPKTGDCLNCTDGTGGPRCSVCAAGFHGAPDQPGGCQPCPCPSRAHNFADACAITGTRLQCLCKPGYTGPECELCAAGFVRNVNGSCEPCACDERGSLSPHCDSAGRCRCRPFATGDKCDQCVARRTFLVQDGCASCDNCTLTLLDSIESLSRHLHHKADLNELSRIPKPFPALREFAQNTSILNRAVHDARRNIENTENLEPLINELETREHRVFTEANNLKKEASRRMNETYYMSEESMNGLEEVLKQKMVIGEQVAKLDEFAREEGHMSAHRALKEARHLLRQIKGVKLFDYVAGVEDVRNMADAQSRHLQQFDHMIENTVRRVRRLQSQLERCETRSDDVPRLADAVWSGSDRVNALSNDVKPRMAKLRDLGLRCTLVLEDIVNLSPHNTTEDIRNLILRASTLSRSLPSITAELQVLNLAAEEKEGILYNLTPLYRDKYLTAVQKHVEMLGEKAKEYKSLFSGARSAASLGVSAAHAWADVAATLRAAGQAADGARADAIAAQHVARGPQPVAGTADALRHASEDLKRRGSNALAKAEELRSQLEHLRQNADQVSVQLRGLGWQERDLGLRPRPDVTGTLAAANEQADRVFTTTRVLYDEASEIRQRVRYNLRRQLTELQKQGDTTLGAAQEHVSQIRGNTLRGRELASALSAAADARAHEESSARAQLNPAVAALKDRIARARHAAESISVSLTSVSGSAVGCARGYPLHTSSPAITKLAIAVSFDNHVKDGTLLYLLGDTEETRKFMKLSVRDQQLHLVWNLGGGEGVILHPDVLQPAHDDGDHTSYRIEIERVWNTVHLSVERVGGSTITAENSTAAAAVALQAQQLWLGAPSDMQDDSDSSSLGLPGCVHALYSEDQLMGLWNFVHQPKEAQCTGCTQRWYNGGRGGDSGMVWLNGAGYVELHRSRLRPADTRHFTLAFTFRTRDENAMLFMARDTVNNRSVSVVLRECRVVFAVEYAGGARLEISATGRHCTGRPAHVQAIRVFAGNKLERGSLRVNGEETLGSPTPPVQEPSALPDLSSAAYWVGGAPPGGVAPQPPLLGCLGALAVDREGYDLLATPKRHGVEARCGSRTLRSATLEGRGFIELPSPPLRRKAAVGVSFAARAPGGLILLRAPSARARTDNEVDDDDDVDDRHYLAVVMVEGEIEVIAAAGKGELRMRTNGTRFDDGRLHTIRLVRAHKQLELFVDEHRLAVGSLPGNAYASRSGGLFIGGADWPYDKPWVPLQGFTGTIADLIVDSTLIGFENAVRWEGARLGRADFDAGPSAHVRTEPRELHEQPADRGGCTKTSSYTVEAGAVKFGDAAGSHAVLRLPARVKELTLALQFRTFANDGLLLLAPGTKSKPKHYTALVVREGKVKLIVRGRKRKEVALTAFVSDGTWRTVSAVLSGGRAVLSLGAHAVRAHMPAAARAPRLYVGGLPGGQANAQLPNSIVRIGGFVGCIRRVSVNGRAEDLVRDAHQHHRVGQCFPNIEQGSYFGGDAYAMYGGVSWNGESQAEMRVRFRSAASDGVLISIRDLLLQLNDGALVLTRQSPSGGEISRTETRGIGGRALCDNVWHTVVVKVSRASVSLALDNGPELKGVATGTLIDDVTDAPAALTPLYIGGLPEGLMESADNGRENFKGCIRDVVAMGQKIEWRQMETLHNVLLDSCPVT